MSPPPVVVLVAQVPGVVQIWELVSKRITPALLASVSDHKTTWPPLVLMFWLLNKVISAAAFSVTPPPAPELVIDPAVEIAWHSMPIVPTEPIVPRELLVNVPELHVAWKLASPLTELFNEMLLPVEVRVSARLVPAVTALETVIAPAVCSVTLPELI